MMYKVTYDLVAIPASDYLVRNTRTSRHIHRDDKFLKKKMRHNARKIRDLFKKSVEQFFPMSTDVFNPAVRDAEMLTGNLVVRLLLARVAGHNTVNRSCIFCIKI